MLGVFELILNFSLETTLPVSWLASDCAAAAGRQRFYMKCEKCRERVARKVVVVAVVRLKPTHKAKQNKVQPNNNNGSDQTRPEIAAEQCRPSATLYRWLRPTTLMTEGHSLAIRRPDDEETSTRSNLR